MNRNSMISNIESNKSWDFIIIGGGATGLGCAIEASSRGYKTLLLEQSDFSKGTSSRSTKLVHGGVRYLKQGNLSLVLEALKERGILRRNAPHLVHDLPFIVPNYDWWEGPFYGIGLKLYDALAGKEGFGPSELLSKEETLKHIPTIEQEGLRGGVIYYDGQFDDARLAINMAETAYEQGATLLNYVKVTSLNKNEDMICGVDAIDLETNKKYSISAKVVINATGVFTDSIRKMDEPECKNIIVSGQGVHIVLDNSFLPGDSAIMVPETDDGRVLFAIPWHKNILVGTTDTPVNKFLLEPTPYEEEIEFLLSHTARYLTKDPTRKDIKSIFAGLRPLVKSGEEENTAAISRDHTLNISRSGLITITGGKWTTYRKMAEDTIDQAIVLAHLDFEESVTKELRIHGYHSHSDEFGNLEIYGSDAISINELLNTDKKMSEKIHPNFENVKGEIFWAVRNEMARTVEDFLSRRTRMLLMDAKASIEAAPLVAEIMAGELNQKQNWIDFQINHYKLIAHNYLVN
ncbi:MAG: glycerol-3-phosphate dehydrogenase/oxidase [Ignavibacteriales bacterium]|nr:glycerol-3-phosphate dehydrogenase/oxidase [Ignavibacteriales bacterium]MCB9259168.1 glycerol-3-phosphate dehydrogenase/oxidase [Ignavibacteriales bacterium]